MYSGSDIPGPDGDRNYPTQWALNPSAYQNVANDQVDWAALAQQWIMMKETCPPEQVPPAPPPPPIGPVKKDISASTTVLVEGGEAPMEVENDKDEVEVNASNNDMNAPPASWTGPGNLNTFMDVHTTGPGSWNWQQQQQQWGWNSNWNSQSAVAGPNTSSVIPNATVGKTPLLPTPYSFPSNETSSSPGFSGSRSNAYATGYWSNNQHNRGRPNKPKTRVESDEDTESGSITLDAAKRRQLPAWIREGLEKMEREKQKQLDKEREAREREEFMKRKKEEEEEVRKVMTDSGIVVLPTKSKFDSDSDESEHETEAEPPQTDERTPPSKRLPRKKDTPEPPSPVRSKSRDERLQDVMLTVRRMMTEILLEVTTDEIETICQEELKRYRASASAMNLQKTPALASLTGKLGLGIYGDSGSSGSDSEHADGDDSDTDLKESIRRRKAEFARTEREIEARVLDVEWRQAENERVQRERDDQRANNINTRDGERYTQVDTANSHHGHLEKIAPRKSRFHDGSVPDPQVTSRMNDYTSAGHTTDSHKSDVKSETNSKRRHRDKSSSSRSRSSSENSDNSQSKSESSSESDSSDSREKRSRKRSGSLDHRINHYDKRRDSSSEKDKRRKTDSDSRNHDRDSSSGSLDIRRTGKVFKDPRSVRSNHKDLDKDSTSKNKNGDNSDSKSRKLSESKNHSYSPDYRSSKSNHRRESSRSSRYSQSPRSRRSRSFEQSSRSRDYSSRSYKRSRTRSRSRRRSPSSRRSRDRSRDKYSRRSPSRDYHRERHSNRRHRSRSHERRSRTRSRDRVRSRSRDYRRSRSRSQHRGKRSHRH